jgi:Uma2 family endonuclease
MSMTELSGIEPEQVRRWTRDDYLRVAETGVFDGERVELLNGVIVRMSPIGAPHVWTTTHLHYALVEGVGKRAWVINQASYDADEHSVPEPDIAVVPRNSDETALPTDAYLLVEVSDSSIGKDRGVKKELYAAIGVPEYWIVNLAKSVVEVYRNPVEGVYTELTTVAKGATLALLAFQDLEIPSASFLR